MNVHINFHCNKWQPGVYEAEVDAPGNSQVKEIMENVQLIYSFILNSKNYVIIDYDEEHLN